MPYLHWDQQIVTDSSSENITAFYDRGYVFTRLSKGAMQQTRSCRIDLSRFELSSENRRVLKKTPDISLRAEALPYSAYDFKIGKLAKDFYTAKFGDKVMSAQKIKEMLGDGNRSNFNRLLVYMNGFGPLGYAICYENSDILHYSYPFYDLAQAPRDMGLGMMIRAIEYAQAQGLKYVYLGSLQRPGDSYKLQFAGLEWFDGQAWQTDLQAAKTLLKELA